MHCVYYCLNHSFYFQITSISTHYPLLYRNLTRLTWVNNIDNDLIYVHMNCSSPESETNSFRVIKMVLRIFSMKWGWVFSRNTVQHYKFQKDKLQCRNFFNALIYCLLVYQVTLLNSSFYLMQRWHITFMTKPAGVAQKLDAQFGFSV